MRVKFLLLFFVFSYLFRTDESFNQDLGRHIKLGEIIIKTHQIPKTNLFSYTNPEFPFINTHWLFEVVAYWFSQTVGLQALLILKVVIILLSVYLILKLVPKENSSLLLLVGFIFLHVLRERLELRPEIFSFLFTSLTYYILERFGSTSLAKYSLSLPKGNLIYLLPLIQLLWINTHIYFFVGLILQAIFLIHLAYQYLRSHLSGGKLKLLGAIFLLSVLVSLVNPNGLAGLLYPLNVNKNYGYTIVENQAMFLLESINFKDPNFLFVKLSMGIIVLSIMATILSSLRKQGSNSQIRNTLISLFGPTLALLNVRSFPYLVFLSLPATLGNFSLGVLSKTPPRWFMILLGSILLIESWGYLSGTYYKDRDSSYQPGLKLVESAKAALDFVQSHNLPGPIFNNFDIGSYIIYRAYPKYQVFVDGRPEAYPKEFFLNTYIPMQSDFAKFKIEEKKRGFKTIIFSHTDQTPWGKNFLQSIIKDEDWKTVYIDDFMIVLVKNDVLDQKKLNSIDLSQLSPNSYQFDNHVSYLRIGYFLLATQNIQSGKKFIEKAAQVYPKSPTVKQLISF